MDEQLPPVPKSMASFEAKLKSGALIEATEFVGFKQQVGGKKFPPEHLERARALIAEYEARKAAITEAQIAHARKVFAPADPPRYGSAPQKGENATAAAPAKLGEPFHNPYTFIPFGTNPVRSAPTLLSADEADKSRFTGVLRIRVRTISPLLSCMPTQTDGVHAVTAIGDDVIVPATGIRGALRTLMTVLTGGTLGYVDPMLWLTQGRDLNLGPRGMNSPPNTPERVFLARVAEPGSATRAGRVELNAASEQLISGKDLAARLPGFEDRRPKPSGGKGPANRGAVEIQPGVFARLSGRPIKPEGKREGIFKPSGKFIELGADLWQAFLGRHAHADFTELKPGDLVWLEPRTPTLDQIRDGNDVASIQWSRWGRRGERLLDAIRKRHGAVLPDSLRGDGLVDEITNLFGHVPDAKTPTAAAAFAGRIRPDNLVFKGAAGAKVDRGVQLAPLMQPHPGCVGFYRENRDLDQISQTDPLRGYKVYRTTVERGASAPWHYATQGVYGEQGTLQPATAKVSRKCDLLQEGVEGELNISLRSLSKRELALLLAACGVDWRLGGGKPLGLGHCRVMHAELVNEFGESQLDWTASSSTAPDRESPTAVPSPYATEIETALAERIRFYQATQRPVARLRYPRAAKRNRNKTNRGGQIWFQRHASPKKAQDKNEQRPIGLQVFRVAGELATRVGLGQVKAQRLPDFDPKSPFADVLYGYDCWTDDTAGPFPLAQGIEPFDPTKHARPDERSGGHQGQSRETRQGERERR
jgi:hypothetical protein